MHGKSTETRKVHENLKRDLVISVLVNFVPVSIVSIKLNHL